MLLQIKDFFFFFNVVAAAFFVLQIGPISAPQSLSVSVGTTNKYLFSEGI